MKTETQKAYLAGLVDGEGHIGITTAIQMKGSDYWRTHCVIVTLANTHLETMTWVKSIWSGTLIIRKQPKQSIPIGNLRWSSRQAIEVLKDIQPYSKIKAAQIRLALQFANLIAEREQSTKFISEEEWDLREELRLAIRQLNRLDPTLKKVPYPIERDTRLCPVCGASFRRYGTAKGYCSTRCYNKASWQRQKRKKLGLTK